MKKLLILVGVLFLVNFVCFGQPMEPVSPLPARQNSVADKRLAAVANPAENASPAPFFGILAAGFLCAGYMTLRAE